MIKKIFIFEILITLFNLNYPLIAQTYNPNAAADYAEEWWDVDEITYNHDYNYYPGNDCANFVSQCLKAGCLDLSKGIDETLPQGWNVAAGYNGVDDWGCIPYCDNLHLHLTHEDINGNYDYQKLIKYEHRSDLGEPDWTGKGDIAIFGNSSDYWQHAVFAVSKNDNNKTLYNAHTTNRQHRPVSWFYGAWNTCDFYHIYPAHCTDCKLNNGETAIDCGGPCPPCEDAPVNVGYKSSTNSLPSVTLAQNDITAGDNITNPTITVEPGQNVEFIAGNTIHLQKGFHAKKGSNFHAKISNITEEITRDCQPLCELNIRNWFCHEWGFYQDLTSATYYVVTIYQFTESYNVIEIYSGSGNINSNGSIHLWNGIDGVNYGPSWLQNPFAFDLYIKGCSGDELFYSHYYFYFIYNCSKSGIDSSLIDSSLYTEYTNKYFNDTTDYSSKEIQNNDDNLPLDIFESRPNPFNNSTQIIFSIQETTNVRLYITNTFGIEVLELVNNELSKGIHNITIKGSALASGIYYCILETKDRRSHIKLVKL